jgi:hypothetical protein
MVVMPPVVDANGIPNNNALLIPEFLSSDLSKGIMAATIMMVAVVFDNNIEMIIVVIIKPINRFRGFGPTTLSVNLKIDSSSFVLFIALARKKPPSNSHIMLSENVRTYGSTFSGAELKWLLPRANTRNAMIKRLTANAGIASVIHNPTENKSRKITYTCESVKPGSLTRRVNIKATPNEIRNM